MTAAPPSPASAASTSAVVVDERRGTRRDGGRHTGARRRPDPWRWREVLLAWLAARVVVGAALAMTHFIADQAQGTQHVTLRTTGLLGWDAGWYRTIAESGYGGAGAESRRFFPLLPMLVRGLAHLPGAAGREGPILLVIVNVCALGLALALVRLAAVEGLGEDATFRLIWFTALAPPAFVLVMGYAEALAGLLAVAVFLGARTRRFELAALAGLLSGLCRPLGVLLVIPVAIEAARTLPWSLPLTRRLGPPPRPTGVSSPFGNVSSPHAASAHPATATTASASTTAASASAASASASATAALATAASASAASASASASASADPSSPSTSASLTAAPGSLWRPGGRLRGASVGWQVAAVLAPLVGAGIYVAWSAHTYGDGFAPFTMQRDAARHGATSNPLAVLWHAASGAFHGELGTALHVPWILLAVVGLVVMYRRLPFSYALWSTLVLVAVLTGSNLDSGERYLYGAFPFLLVAALVTARREIFTATLVAATTAMTLYATLAFTLAYVP